MVPTCSGRSHASGRDWIYWCNDVFRRAVVEPEPFAPYSRGLLSVGTSRWASFFLHTQNLTVSSGPTNGASPVRSDASVISRYSSIVPSHPSTVHFFVFPSLCIGPIYAPPFNASVHAAAALFWVVSRVCCGASSGATARRVGVPHSPCAAAKTFRRQTFAIVNAVAREWNTGRKLETRASHARDLLSFEQTRLSKGVAVVSR